MKRRVTVETSSEEEDLVIPEEEASSSSEESSVAAAVASSSLKSESFIEPHVEIPQQVLLNSGVILNQIHEIKFGQG